tara:strand:- start:13 stop:450 length:438 start_codon:yes stop_codon:yes gene_type:complete
MKSAVLLNTHMVIKMLCKDGSTYSVEETDIIAWERAYEERGVKVRQELASMDSWLDANPSRRKTPKGMKRFIDSWLKRAAQTGGSPTVRAKKDSLRNIPVEHKLVDVSWVQCDQLRSICKDYYIQKVGYYFDGEVKNGKNEKITI